MDRNQTTFRNVRSMPQWVNENHSRIGPKPPPPPPTKNIPPPLPKKNAPDPDYEVIEFGQQYSNPGLSSKTLETEIKKPGIKCELCGSLKPTIKCEQCQQHLFCSSCDDMYHRHPKRQTHSRKFIDKTFKPPLPPKGEGNLAPQPPPRRHKNKLMGNFLSSSNGNHMTNGPKDGQVSPPHLIRPQPPPSPTLSLREKMGTLKRMINPGNRPLPPTPDQKPSSRPPSRPQTPNAMPSPFDTIRRAPSLTMEKIQNQTTATLDRMTQLQQRYKQHQEAMRTDSDRSRRTSMASDMDMDMRIDQLRNRQQTIPVARNMSSSVQNLNQLNYRPPPQPGIGPGGGWSTTPMQQAQSMAHLNAPPPGLNPWQQPQQQMWNNFEPQINGGSNMSLNMPQQGYFYPPENRPPPPVWMNSWGPTPMYPYPIGMVPMSPMLGHRAQASSRSHSRAASPALSLRSRRSMMSNRKSHRNAYPKDLTDDEDSDLSDRELSPRSNRDSRPRRESFSHKDTLTRRPRKNSSSGFEFENENEPELAEPKFQKKSHINRTRSPIHKLVTPSPPPPPKIAAPIPVKPKVVTETQSAFYPVNKNNTPVVPPKIGKPPSSSEEEEEDDEDEDEEEQPENDETEIVKNIRQIRIDSPEPKPSVAAPIANLDDDDLGPPPEAPDHEWECEFCTFVNEANTKICLVCCKTPTQVPNKPKPVTAPVKTPKSPSPKPPPAPVAMKRAASPVKQTAPSKINKKGETKKITKKMETETETEIPRTTKAAEISARKTTSEESSSDAGKMKEPRPKSPHWIDLLEVDSEKHANEGISTQTQPNDENEFEEQIPAKITTGCGPSPPKEILSTPKKFSKSPTPHKDLPKNIEKTKSAVKKMSVSTGTSPPPQTISTQTYDLPQSQPLTRDRSSHSIRRSHSMVAQNLPMNMPNDYNTTRSFSRQSFSSDTQSQSLPMTPPEDVISPSYGSKLRNQQLLDDEAIAYINRTLNSYGIPPTQRKAGEGRYRSIHDLRRSDSYRARKMSLGDFHQAQRSRHSQQRQLLDDNNITLDDIIALKRQEAVAPSGIELIRLLREADQYNFSAEDLQAALTHCGQANPVTWLRENWSKLIETVQTLATKYGQERPENTIGTISVIEAREALRLHKGNVWHAVTECIEQRSKKFQEIASRGHYSREDIVTSLTAHHGNVEMALVELGKTQLKPFLMKIWGPPSGAENESGNMLYDMEQMNGNGYYDEFHAQDDQLHKQQTNSITEAFSPMSSSSLISDKKFDDNQINPYYNNSNILRDIEALIGNIEQNQAKQNENMMKNIENLLGNILQQRNSKSPSPFQSKLEIANSYERLNTKSPIIIPKSQGSSAERTIVENDIRKFMTQHIQDVSPDVVEHVQQDIRDQDNELILILPEMQSPPVANNDLTEHELEMINKAIHEAEQASLEPSNNIPAPPENNVPETLPNRNDDLTDHELEMINKAISDADQVSLRPINNNEIQVEANVENNASEVNSSTNENHNNLSVDELEMINKAISEADGISEPANSVEESQNTNMENTEIENVLNESIVPETVVEHTIVKELPTEATNPKIKAKLTNKRQRGIASGRKKSIVVDVPNSFGTREIYPPIRPNVKEIPIPPILDTNQNKELDHIETELTADKATNAKREPTPSFEPQTLESTSHYVQVLPIQEPIPISQPSQTTELTADVLVDEATNAKREPTPSFEPQTFESTSHYVQVLSIQEPKPISQPSQTKKSVVKKQNHPTSLNMRATKIPVKRASNILSPKTNKQRFELQPSQNVPSTSIELNQLKNDKTSSTDPDIQDSSERKTSTATIILQSIAVTKQNELVEKAETPVSETNRADLLKNHQESSIEEDVFEDTEHFDSPPPPPTITVAQSATSPNYVNTLEIKSDDDLENTSLEPHQPYAIMKQPSQNLSELVMDTQKLIKQMRDEITSDIHSSASYVSDDDYTLRTDDDDEYEDESGSFEWTDDDEEGEQTFGEEMEAEEEEIFSGPENEEDDGWTDVSTNFDSENEENLQEIKEILEEDLNNIERFNSVPPEEQNEDQELVDNAETTFDENQSTTAISPEPIPIQKILEIIEIVEEPYIEPHIAYIEEVATTLHEYEVTEVIPPSSPEQVSGTQPIIDEPPIAQLVVDTIDVIESQNDNKHPIDPPPKVNAAKKTFVRKRSITNQSPITPSNNIKSIQSKFLNNNNTPKSSPTGTIPKQIGTTNAKPISTSIKTLAGPSSKLQPLLKQSMPALTNSKSTTITSLNKNDLATVNNLPIINNDNINSTMNQQQQLREAKKATKIRYRETCFSDDQYETSDEENQSNTTVKWPTKEFYKISKTIEDNEELLKEDHAVLVKKFLEEGKVGSICEGELVVSLLELKFDQDSAIWASSQCKTIDEAIIILRKDCELCLENYSLNEFVQMLKCSHQCCKNCARNYFSVQITERAITDCTCPYCKIPELHDPNTPEDEVVEYFSNLDIILKNILSTEDHELFQRKLRDRALLQDPNFKWCIECSSGFVAGSKHRVLECPDCKSRTCASCRKPWADQHKGISCQQFAEWKELNDPEIQNEGFKKHLQMHGLQCPNCKFQYSLVRGGCMHFTCTQCKYEFCYGCSKPFKIGAKCTISNYCAKLGLHAHHPRNCLYFLRDKEPHELQNLLRIHNIPFETESLQEQMQIEGTNHPHTVLRCLIPLQKDTPAGLVDTVCNGDVTPNHAGLCRNHYIEYLCKLIKNHDIDTLDILTADDLEILVRRANKRMPPRPYGIIEGIYRQYLLQGRLLRNLNRDHFVEYLCNCVRKSNIDPCPILDLNDCSQELKRHFIPLPERGPWDTDPIYREMCIKIVQDQIPLD